MTSDIDSLYKIIAMGCAEQLPAQWQRCIMNYQKIERYGDAVLYFEIPQGKKKYYKTPTAVLDAFKLLRAEMAKLNNGQAWYTAVFTMTPDGKFKFDFDYDHLPAFDIMPEPDKWQDEFKKYPRPELQAQIQDWLDGTIDYDRADELVQRLADLQRKR